MGFVYVYCYGGGFDVLAQSTASKICTVYPRFLGEVLYFRDIVVTRSFLRHKEKKLAFIFSPGKCLFVVFYHRARLFFFLFFFKLSFSLPLAAGGALILITLSGC